MIFKQIPEYPHYFVTETGKVFSVAKGRKMKELNQWKSKDGYWRACFFYRGKVCAAVVHSVVLTAFAGPRPLGMQGSHLDGDKNNNNFSNLKWVTPSENAFHKVLHGTQPIGSQALAAKLTEEEIPQICDLIKNGFSLRWIGRTYGVNFKAITAIRDGKTWKHVSSYADAAYLAAYGSLRSSVNPQVTQNA